MPLYKVRVEIIPHKQSKEGERDKHHYYIIANNALTATNELWNCRTLYHVRDNIVGIHVDRLEGTVINANVSK